MSEVALFFIVVGVIATGVAMWLVNFARQSARAKLQLDKTIKKTGLPRDLLSDNALRQAIFEEVTDFVDSRENREAIANKLSSLFNKEVEKRVEETTDEVSRKFEDTLKEKAKNEEVTWKKYNKVLTEKRETEAVIRSIAEGLVVVDDKGKVVMMNPAAERLLGVSKEKKIGESISDDMRDNQLISMVKEPSDRGSKDRELEIMSPDDETKRILRASSAVIEDENGGTVGMVSVLSDVTKQRELDRLKTNFVTSVSHELRTPIVAIDKSIAMILGNAVGDINDQQKQFLEIAERNLKRLRIMIDDLLDLSKLEAGKMELKLEKCSVEPVIDDSISTLNNWAKTKSIDLQKNIQQNMPQINADAARLTQVLNNLISNAIKFTPNNGSITVSAIYDKDDKQVEVSVQDTGVGIPKEALPKVFSKFYQIGERTTSDISGTGVGLSIAKEFIELHGGKIWVESEKNEGAKFTFSLSVK